MEKYTNLINSNNIIIISFLISLFCIITNKIIETIKEKRTTKKEEIQNNKSVSTLECLGIIISFIIIVIIIVFAYRSTIIKNIMYIPIMLFSIYVVYIMPIFKPELKKFEDEYSSYGAILTWGLIFFASTDITPLLNSIENKLSTETIVIIILFIQIYTSIYCIIINLYFVLKNIQFKFAVTKISKLINKCYDITLLNNTNMEFNSIKLLKERKIVNRLLLFPLLYILDILRQIITVLFSIIFMTTLGPILFLIRGIISVANKISKTNEYITSYKITKIVLIIGLLSVYIIVLINEKLFSVPIISIYEFISTSIIIPLILEELISLKINSKK